MRLTIYIKARKNILQNLSCILSIFLVYKNRSFFTGIGSDLKNEIMDLKEYLRFKSEQLTVAEQIAKSQMMEAHNIIKTLNQNSTDKV